MEQSNDKQIEVTPESLAQKIFSQPPKAPKSNQLLLDKADPEYVFQLLMNVLTEGVDILYGKEADFTQVNDAAKFKLKEYINSLGFELHIDTCQNNIDISKEPYYCQVRKNDFPDYFLKYAAKHSGHNQYAKKYRFILNGRNFEIERNKLSDYYAIFFNDKVKYKLHFDFLY